MGFQEVADLDCATCIALGGTDKKSGKKNPTSISGFYLGARQVPSTKSKTGFASLHVIKTSKGNVGVWGKTNMDQKLAAVDVGHMIRITFTGMMETKNNPMYVYKVEVDASQTDAAYVAANAAPEQDTYDDSQGYGDDDNQEEQGLDDDAPPADEPPPARPARATRPAQAPSPQAQARVNSLLGKRSAN